MNEEYMWNSVRWRDLPNGRGGGWLGIEDKELFESEPSDRQVALARQHVESQGGGGSLSIT